MTLSKSTEEIRKLQESIKNLSVDFPIEEGMKVLQEAQEASSRLGDNPAFDLAGLRTLQERFSGSTLQRTQIIAQILVMHGLSKLPSLIGADDLFRKKFDKEYATALELLVGYQTRANADRFAPPPLSIDLYENGMISYDNVGLNPMNRWRVVFGENKSLQDSEDFFLAESCKEISIEGYSFTTTKNDIIFSKQEDVSDIQIPASATFTFIYDRDLIVRKALETVVGRMRNQKTGRYGYKDDYMWSNIDIPIFDNSNKCQRVYRLYEAVISGVSELGLDYTPATDIKTCQATVAFSRMEWI